MNRPLVSYPQLKDTPASHLPFSPAVVVGDHISLLIDTASNSYYEIAINPANIVVEIDHGKDGKGVHWTSGAQFAVQTRFGLRHRGIAQCGLFQTE